MHCYSVKYKCIGSTFYYVPEHSSCCGSILTYKALSSRQCRVPLFLLHFILPYSVGGSHSVDLQLLNVGLTCKNNIPLQVVKTLS
jgi:hypothetical protein